MIKPNCRNTYFKIFVCDCLSGHFPAEESLCFYLFILRQELSSHKSLSLSCSGPLSWSLALYFSCGSLHHTFTGEEQHALRQNSFQIPTGSKKYMTARCRYSSYLKAQFCSKGIIVFSNNCTVIKPQTLCI